MEIFEPEFGEDNLRGSSSWSSISSPAHTIIDDSNISNWGWPCPDESCACEQNWNGVLSEERVLQSTPDNDSAQVMREVLPQVLRCFSRNQHRASDARSVVFQKLTCSDKLIPVAFNATSVAFTIELKGKWPFGINVQSKSHQNSPYTGDVIQTILHVTIFKTKTTQAGGIRGVSKCTWIRDRQSNKCLLIIFCKCIEITEASHSQLIYGHRW